MRRRADSGKTVLFSTHILDTAEKVCDRIAVINRAKSSLRHAAGNARAFPGERVAGADVLEITEEGKDV